MPSARKEDESDRNSGSRVLTLDLSGKGIQRIEPLPDGMSPQTLLYNNNNIFRIENLQFFEHLQQLSLADNHLVEMTGISQAQGLKVLDLSNNSIITIEGLTHLRSLEWLNLSGNTIKRIQNLEKNINLCHLDFSDNSIFQISNLRNLVKLKVLLLHGNLITSPKNVAENISEASIVTLSLAENEISDLSELYYFRSFTSLEQLSITGNPCLMALPTLSGFNYRPYILYNCPRLHNLDGQLISQIDRLEADRLRRDGTMRKFSPGRHSQLVTYLSQTTPLRPSSARAPPTPNIDRISSSASSMPHDDQKWSVPVHNDKHSTEAGDLALEDVSASESDDQLVSESCYVPVDSILLSPTQHEYVNRGSGDLYTNEENRSNHINHEKGWSLDVDTREKTDGVPVERDPDMEADRIRRESQDIEVTEDQNHIVAEPPHIMSEEEAFSLIHLAATIIQAHVRGFLVRRKLDFYEYRHRHKAATLIQATWRGYRTRTFDIKVITTRNEIRARRLTAHINHLAAMVLRCQEQVAKDKRTMAKAIKCLWNELEKQNNRNVVRLSREQNNAAITIQRSWKGYQARKMYPLSNRSSMTPLQSLAMVCQDLQIQVNLMKSEIEKLDSDKGRRVSVVAPPRPHKLDRVKSTPEIRITRPSICLLPERLQLNTNQPIKCERSVEELLNDEDDFEIEPLDLGKYEGAPSVCDTTFDVEETENREDVESNDSESKSKDSKSNEDKKANRHEIANEDVEANSSGTDPYKGIRTASKSKTEVSQTPELNEDIQNDLHSTRTIDEEEEESGEQIGTSKVQHEVDSNADDNDNNRDKEGQNLDGYAEESMTENVVSAENNFKSSGDFEKDFPEEVETTVNIGFVDNGDMSGFVPGHQDGDERDELIAGVNIEREGKKEATPSLIHEQPWIDDSAKSDKNLLVKTDKNDISSSEETLTGGSDMETTSTSPQAGLQNTDTSTSDASPSPSKPEGIIARKKKKLLLRSSSAEAMPRIRALHSCHSLDSEQLSSSLNFSSRLGQRTAALLLELRSDIASLTARQFSDDYFDTQESVTTEGHVTKSSKTEAKDCETDVESGVNSDSTATTIENTDKPSKSMSDSIIRDIKAIEVKTLRSSDSGISCQALASNDPEILPKGYTADNDMRTRGGNRSRDDSLEKDSATVREYDLSGNVNEVGSREERGQKDRQTSQSDACVVQKPSSRPSLFAMPVFEDFETFSDFMDDSLDDSDD